MRKIGDANDVEKIPGANNSTLTISSVQKSNEGSYRCTVSNCAGSEASEYATLTVGKNCCEEKIQFLCTIAKFKTLDAHFHCTVCSARTQLQCSLVPRPSPAPVFDQLQYAKTEPEGLVNLTT